MAIGLRGMSATEFDEWREFYRREPFGPGREDLRAGTIASMLSASTNARPESFFPNLRVPDDADPEEQAQRDIEALQRLAEDSKHWGVRR